MAYFDKLSFTKTWILSKYSKYVFKDQMEDKWKVRLVIKYDKYVSSLNFISIKTLNSSDCCAPINLSLTPTNFLVINCENEIQVTFLSLPLIEIK